ASGGPCAAPDDTYIGACGIDGAGLALAQLYGPLEAKSELAQGALQQFSQRPFTDEGSGLASIGYVYIPPSCTVAGCRLHVVFHGCEQYASGPEGTRFVTETGYREWA